MKYSKILVGVGLEDMQKRGTIRKLIVLAAMAPVMGLITLGAVHAIVSPPPVNCGDVLLSDTKLVSTDPVVSAPCAGAGLIIGASGITLDCDGFTISGPGSGWGIDLTGVTGVTLKGCTVTNFGAGIVLNGSSGNTIKDNTATGITSGGSGGFTLINSSDGNTLMDNTATSNNGRGFVLHGSSNNTLMNNMATDNRFRGFDFTGSSNGNNVMNNTATNNSSAGFVCSGGSTGNEFKGNESSNSQFEGFAIFSSGNTFKKNLANNNGSFGYRDSTGPANTYPPLTIGNGKPNPIANLCQGNGSGGSSPPGLCRPQS